MTQTVKIVSSPAGTTCVLPTGEPLLGVSRIAWSAELDDIAQAEITIWADTVEVEGKLQMFVCHPITGLAAEVAHIAFADGSCWAPSSLDASAQGEGRVQSQG
jgi:hypothetical protein